MAIFEQNTTAMMKKISLFLAFQTVAIAQLVIIAQPIGEPVEAGYVVENVEPIIGLKYNFPGSVVEVLSVPEKQMILVKSIAAHNKWGEPDGCRLLAYRVSDGSRLWGLNLENHRVSLLLEGDFLAVEGLKFCKWYNLETGEELWSTKTRFIHFDNEKNVGVGFHKLAGGELGQKVRAVDLNDGSEIWRAPVFFGQEYEDLHIYGDSMMVFRSNFGLHRVSFKDGDTWDYKLKTRKADGAAIGASIGAGILFGLLGVMVVPDPEGYTKQELQSNMVVHNEFIYAADKKHIAKIGPDGKQVWTQRLPKEMGSQSLLTVYQGLVSLVNTGLGYDSYGQPMRTGAPTIAAFDEYDGAARFLKPIECGGEHILDLHVSGQDARMLTRNSVIRYNLSNGIWAYTRMIAGAEGNQDAFFVHEEFYDLSDERFFPVSHHPRFSHIIGVANGDMLILDDDDELIDRVPMEHAYRLMDSHNDMHIFTDGNAHYLADSELSMTAELPNGHYAFFTDEGIMVVADEGVYDIRWEANPSLLAY